MSPVLYLSHVLDEDTPGYGGKPGFFRERATSITKGDSSNSSRWTLSNHIGTHIDAPFHFEDGGVTVDTYPASFWIFERPFLVDHELEANEFLRPGRWCEELPCGCDLLLIRTGFEKRRHSKQYWEENPGLTEDLGIWLRGNRPQVRAIGIDVISATPFQNRAAGRAAHCAFLRSKHPRSPILIIEDMALGKLKQSPARVMVFPLRVAAADGSPVTVIAEES